MAQNTEKGIKVKITTDTTGFNKSLKDINKELREAQSEFKKTDTEVKHLGQSNERSKTLHEQLSKQVQLHTQKVDLYKQSIEKTKSKLDDDIKTREKLKSSLDSANKKYQDAVKIYGEESKEAKKAKEEVDKLTKEHEKNEKAISASESRLKTYNTSLNKAETELIKTKGALNNVTKELKEQDNKWLTSSKKLGEYKDKLHKAGEVTNNIGNTLLKINAPLLGLGAGAIKVSMDFEKSMSNVKAISGATGEDIKKLEDKAREMGAATSKSASESADAMGYMALAGWKTQEMLEGIEPILRLSEAGNLDLAKASDLVTDSMSALGITTKGLGGYLDKVAQTSANSNTNIDALMTAFLACGGTANNLGINTNELSATLGVMANRGIKSAEAGNSLNSILINLTAPVGQAKKALKELNISAFDSQGKFKGLEAVLLEVKGKTDKMTEAQKNQYLAMIGGKEQSKALQAMLTGLGEEYGDLKGKIDNSNGALGTMAKTMQDNLHGRILELKSKVEELGLKFGETLLPHAEKVVNVLGILVDKFASLSPETQEAIVNAVLMGTAIGGVAKIGAGAINTVGTLAGGLSTLTGWLAKGATSASGLGGAIGSVGTASTVASGAGGLGALGNVLTKIPLLCSPAGLAVAGVTAVVGALGYGTYKAMTQEAIPSIDLFAEHTVYASEKIKGATETTVYGVKMQTVTISEETKKAVGAYMEMDKGATSALNNLYYNSTKLTDENTKGLVSKYNEMNTTVVKSMQDRFTKEYGETEAFFKKTSALTEKEEAEILKTKKENNEKAIKEENDSNKKIMDILNKAKKGKRELTEEEQKEINAIQDKKRENAVKTLSKEEVESKIILERLKKSAGRLTAEQASEVIKNADKQYKGAKEKAEKQYDATMAQIIRMRDETGEITKEQADKLIEEAERQKTESIKKAEEMKGQVVNKVKEQNQGIEKDVSTSTGKILTWWDKLKNWWDSWKPGKKEFNTSVTTTNTTVNRSVQGNGGRMPENWTGNRHFGGGLTTLHERGWEVYDLPKGTRIFNHESSQEMVLKTAEKVAEKVASRVMQNFSGGKGDTTLNIYSPKQLDPHEVARQTTKALREMAVIG